LQRQGTIDTFLIDLPRPIITVTKKHSSEKLTQALQQIARKRMELINRKDPTQQQIHELERITQIQRQNRQKATKRTKTSKQKQKQKQTETETETNDPERDEVVTKLRQRITNRIFKKEASFSEEVSVAHLSSVRSEPSSENATANMKALSTPETTNKENEKEVNGHKIVSQKAQPKKRTRRRRRRQRYQQR
jgi:hypothetical protein